MAVVGRQRVEPVVCRTDRRSVAWCHSMRCTRCKDARSPPIRPQNAALDLRHCRLPWSWLAGKHGIIVREPGSILALCRSHHATHEDSDPFAPSASPPPKTANGSMQAYGVQGPSPLGQSRSVLPSRGVPRLHPQRHSRFRPAASIYTSVGRVGIVEVPRLQPHIQPPRNTAIPSSVLLHPNSLTQAVPRRSRLER